MVTEEMALKYRITQQKNTRYSFVFVEQCIDQLASCSCEWAVGREPQLRKTQNLQECLDTRRRRGFGGEGWGVGWKVEDRRLEVMNNFSKALDIENGIFQEILPNCIITKKKPEKEFKEGMGKTWQL